MDRRTFITLAAAGGLCFASRNAVSGPAIAAEEPFPILFEDYEKVGTDYVPRLVDYETGEPRGTIVVDPDNRFLYLVLGQGRAKRYGIGVGREGFGWAGTALIKRKAKWPVWVPPEEMQLRDKQAAQWRKGMPGGPKNPLGARALYLYQGEVDTLYRIHGTSEPGSIGRAVSSGCIRMLNPDIVELFDRVPLGTKVVVLPRKSPAAREADRPTASVRKRTKAQVKSDESHKGARSRFIERRQRQRTIFGLFGFRED
jgi:lipoprotein-anchoring transpeptidase ErfK/SrfK